MQTTFPLMISEERFNELILPRSKTPRDRRFLRDSTSCLSSRKGTSTPTVQHRRRRPRGPPGRLRPQGARNSRLGQAAALAGVPRQDRATPRGTRAWAGDAPKTSGPDRHPTLMLRWDVKEWDKEDAVELLKEAGYTPEEPSLTTSSVRDRSPYPDLRSFKVSVEYVLDGESLVARIPAEASSYPWRVIDPATGERGLPPQPPSASSTTSAPPTSTPKGTSWSLTARERSSTPTTAKRKRRTIQPERVRQGLRPRLCSRVYHGRIRADPPSRLRSQGRRPGLPGGHRRGRRHGPDRSDGLGDPRFVQQGVGELRRHAASAGLPRGRGRPHPPPPALAQHVPSPAVPG